MAAVAGKAGIEISWRGGPHPESCRCRGAGGMKSREISVDVIVIPDEIFWTRRRRPRPKGMYWEKLTAERIASVPLLAALGDAR